MDHATAANERRWRPGHGPSHKSQTELRKQLYALVEAFGDSLKSRYHIRWILAAPPYWKSLIKTISLLAVTLTTASFFPSRLVSKVAIVSEPNFVNCLGAPPATGRLQTLDTPLASSRYKKSFQSRD